jgi:hypothetical protein
MAATSHASKLQIIAHPFLYSEYRDGKAERFCCQVRPKPRQIELNQTGLKIGYSRCR